MFSKISSLGLFGLNAFAVDVEIDVSRGAPHFEIVGLPDAVVRESRERIRSAMRSCGIGFPVSSVMVNLAPADTKKSGSVHDMAIFMALVKAMGLISRETDNSAFIGELSLNGDIRKINGVLPMVMLAKEKGIRAVFVPNANVKEASVTEGIEVYGVRNVSELMDHFRGVKKIERAEVYVPQSKPYSDVLDFVDVKGQENAKKAFEIAGAGGHNILLIGSPGSGKSMLAKRTPSILPPLSFSESLETTKIHSICGLLSDDTPIITERPFRSPHHTISSAGLVGGGTVVRPGEISLAHNGVLFLDELAEFDRKSLEVMRQPLEDRKITVARVSGTVTYPCNVMLIGAMNPCPCGYYGHPTRKCICTQKKVQAYLSRISGPMLDRFDLHVEVSPVKFDDFSVDRHSESSAEMRERVFRAREIQNQRFKGTSITCNAMITPDILSDVCVMDPSAEDMLRAIFDNLGLSARAYDRILKVARTCADIDGSDVIQKNHIAMSAQYRSLDRKYWSGY